MTSLSGGTPAYPLGGAGRRLISGWVRDMPASPAALLALAGLPVVAAAWALLSPPLLLSKTMTQDLLFNLAGAWHIHSGQVAHVDFHDPTGRLSFVLTALGFDLLGPGPFAFLVNVAVMAAVLFAAAILAAMRRLPLLPAAIFVVFVSLVALMPANVGDRPEQYTFAMSYNRYGWSAYSILALVLLVPPHGSDDGRRDRRVWIDVPVAAVLLAAMFYLKITYFAAGLGTLAFALLFQRHVGRHWKAWLIVSALLVLNVLAPYNQAYVADILHWAQSGAARTALTMHVNNFLASIGQYAPYLVAIVVALWMWWSRRATFRVPLTLAFLLATSFFLLSQNSQSAGLPTGIVVLLILYDRLRAAFATLGNRDVVPWLLMLLLFPALDTASAAASVAGYHARARSSDGLYVVDRTNLRGLALPDGERGVFLSFSYSFDYPGRSKDGSARPLYQLSDHEYVLALMEAADLMASREPGTIALLDSVNPLPFMLGYQPARAGNLWSSWSAPLPPAEDYLAGVRYVLVPKFPTTPQWTDDLLRLYGPYLRAHFEVATETRCWTLLARVSGGGPSLSLYNGH
ncbi:MAG: hypothetical protein ACOY4R_24495 [Pseudomonadota bacterium]